MQNFYVSLSRIICKYDMRKHLFTTLTAAVVFAAATTTAQTHYDYSVLQCERLDRGVVAVRTCQDSVLVSWRYLDIDPIGTTFEVLRGSKVIARPAANAPTFILDNNPGNKKVKYTVRAIPPKTESGMSSYHGDPARLAAAAKLAARGSWTLPADAPTGYIDIPLTLPDSLIDDQDHRVGYIANDATMADLDGDGRMEIVLKWDPSNSRDNSQSGLTSPTYFDAISLDGRLLWRVNLGRNIRSGAHYTPFIVADLDGDGCAELLVRTSDGTTDGTGTVIGDADADHRVQPNADTQYGAQHFPREEFRGPDAKRRRGGFINRGPEFVTVFDGRTGRAIDSAPYIPERGELRAWGDNYANRSDRFLAACAYLDGQHLSAVFCRGYYTRTGIAAYDFDGQRLTTRWVFDTINPEWADYAGQGNHNLRVGDVDGDGCDEIIYGSMALDHDGTGLYNTGFGHGDAMHLTAFFPPRPTPLPLPQREGSGHLSQVEEDMEPSLETTPSLKFPSPFGEGSGVRLAGGGSSPLQIWDCHENKRDGSELRDAATGQVIFQILSNKDVGRCMAADIDPANPGLEMWSSASGGICNVRGEVIDSTARIPINFGIWWDGDLLREMLDHEAISKYIPLSSRMSPYHGDQNTGYNGDSQEGEAGKQHFDFSGSSSCPPVFVLEGTAFNNGTKSNPCLCADVIGDWREEVLARTPDSRHLRLYVSQLPTKYRFHTFLTDPVYRHSVTMQNVGYNQPTNVGFYFGAELEGSGLLFRGWQFDGEIVNEK